MIEAIFFCVLTDLKEKKQEVECFSVIINQIEIAIKIIKTNSEALKIVVMIKKILKNEQVKFILKRIMKRVSKYFRDLSKVFDLKKIIKLSSHRFYDHKIELLNDAESLFRSRVYSLFAFKFRKLKKYLKDNLSKDFITSNKIAFVSSMLFAVKLNDQLRLCVNYKRFNQIIKRNRYFILLIEKTLIRVQNCKYLIKLNIISIFNKLRMSEKSEKLITFVIFMSSYKYRVLSFELTNDSTSWQHYMNDLLFSFLNNFCQIYLDDILIYSKFKREHIAHVRVVLEKLKKANLQVDIEKCEFFKQKIFFLDVLLSVESFRMNSKKIEIIVNWEHLINLKKVQAFVDFVNFYRRFIRDFSKKIRTLIRMIKKLIEFE